MGSRSLPMGAVAAAFLFCIAGGPPRTPAAGPPPRSAIPCAGTATGPLGADIQADEEGDDEGAKGKEEGTEEEKPPSKRGPSPLEEKVLELFHASQKTFDDGRITLVYDFQEREDALLDDWLPRMAALKPRLHWSTSGESDIATREDSSSYSSTRRRSEEVTGLVLSDRGQWMHKASFLSDVAVDVEVMNLAIHRQGTVIAPIFFNTKKKEAIGTHGGFQAIALSGAALSRPPLPPKTDQIVARCVRQSFGYRLEGKRLQCDRNGRKVLDTASSPHFADGFETGHVGLHWAGSVQCFVFRVTISGRLDPDWVSAELGGEKKAEKKQEHPASDAGKSKVAGKAKDDSPVDPASHRSR